MASRMLRPRAVVLPDSALLPAGFTHEVLAEQPFHRAVPKARAKPDGSFPAGTKLRLIAHDGGAICQVEGGDGAPLYTAFAGLRPLRRG